MITEQNRINALDNLRAILALIGIPFHVAFFLMLASLQTHHVLFHLRSEHLLSLAPTRHEYFIPIIFYIHTFRMPAFFLLAGFFAHLLYSKRGATHLLKNRLLRIGLPFLFYFLWTIPLYFAGILIIGVQKHQTFFLTLMQAIHQGAFWHYIDNLNNYWFLYYLLIFYAVILILLLLSKINFIVQVMQPIYSALKKILLTRWIYFILPIIFAAIFLKAHYWYVILDERLLPSVYLLAIYSIWILIGWFFWEHQIALKNFMRFAWVKIGISFLAYVLYLFLYFYFINANHCFLYATCVVLYSISMTLGVLGCLGIAWRYLPKCSGVLQYFSKASYSIFLIQVPIVFLCVQVMRSVTDLFFLQFFSATVISAVICIVSYHVFIRRTWLQKIVG